MKLDKEKLNIINELFKILSENTEIELQTKKIISNCPFCGGKKQNFTIDYKGNYNCEICHQKGNIKTVKTDKLIKCLYTGEEKCKKCEHSNFHKETVDCINSFCDALGIITYCK